MDILIWLVFNIRNACPALAFIVGFFENLLDITCSFSSSLFLVSVRYFPRKIGSCCSWFLTRSIIKFDNFWMSSAAISPELFWLLRSASLKRLVISSFVSASLVSLLNDSNQLCAKPSVSGALKPTEKVIHSPWATPLCGIFGGK